MDLTLVFASIDGEVDKAEMLIAKGARVDARYRDFTPLLAAAQFGHSKVCEVLLTRGGANIEETGPEGSALMSAALNGHASTVTMLLSQRARIDVREQGFTPLLARL